MHLTGCPVHPVLSCPFCLSWEPSPPPGPRRIGSECAAPFCAQAWGGRALFPRAWDKCNYGPWRLQPRTHIPARLPQRPPHLASPRADGKQRSWGAPRGRGATQTPAGTSKEDALRPAHLSQHPLLLQPMGPAESSEHPRPCRATGRARGLSAARQSSREPAPATSRAAQAARQSGSAEQLASARGSRCPAFPRAKRGTD